MKTVILTQGYSTKVDDDDYKRLSLVKWFAQTQAKKNL